MRLQAAGEMAAARPSGRNLTFRCWAASASLALEGREPCRDVIVIRILVNGRDHGRRDCGRRGHRGAGYTLPVPVCGGTALLAFRLGSSLEAARLRNELPFYFDAASRCGSSSCRSWRFVEALMKGVLAGLAALFTFSGTDYGRLFWVAVSFGR